jgi:hypothetical protein
VTTWDDLDAFPAADQPGDHLPDMPPDITELTGQQLMILYGALQSWGEYAATCLQESRDQERRATGALRRATAEAMANVTGQKTVAGIKAIAALAPEVEKATEELEDTVSVRERFQLVCKDIDDRKSLCSREITRRQGDAFHEHRTSKWGT